MPNDFISRATVLSDIEHTIENSGCANHEREIIDCVRYADAADVAPVVRCKDCKSAGGFANGPVYCRRTGDAVPEMHFCGYGLRMDAKEDAK